MNKIGEIKIEFFEGERYCTEKEIKKAVEKVNDYSCELQMPSAKSSNNNNSLENVWSVKGSHETECE